MNKICFLIAMYAMSCFALSAQPKPRNQPPVRDISKYDTIGPFVLGNEHAFESDYRAMGEIRCFIWEHWRVRHRGWLSATFYTIEGVKKEYPYGGVTLITIEPTAVNSNGVRFLN